jgi:hemimethylated DNA binding protein
MRVFAAPRGRVSSDQHTPHCEVLGRCHRPAPDLSVPWRHLRHRPRQAIPEEIRPRKDQPFYHLLAENDETEYIAYVSEQNLVPDTSGKSLRNPKIAEMFVTDDEGRYVPTYLQAH